jgi:hypothetical protein
MASEASVFAESKARLISQRWKYGLRNEARENSRKEQDVTVTMVVEEPAGGKFYSSSTAI